MLRERTRMENKCMACLSMINIKKHDHKEEAGSWDTFQQLDILTWSWIIWN